MDKAEIEKTRNFIKNNLAQESRITDRFFKEAKRNHLGDDFENYVLRDEFSRDADRIVYTKSFRRLEHKEQVYSNKLGDHYRTRLTHSLEVAQISKSICRNLGLNENLSISIALGHDIGHAPFGHSGERVLDDIMRGNDNLGGKLNFLIDYGGFKHNFNGLKIVEIVEKRNERPGLNLTWQTLDGILKHTDVIKKDKRWDLTRFVRDASKYESIMYYDYFDDESRPEYPFSLTMEGQVAAISDEIAQREHDMDDSLLDGDLYRIEDLAGQINSIIEDIKKDSSIKECSGYDLFRALELELAQLGRIDNHVKWHAMTSTIISYFIIDVSQNSMRNVSEIFNFDEVISVDENNRKHITKNLVYFSQAAEKFFTEIDEFVENRIINSFNVNRYDGKGKYILKKLFKAYYENPRQMPRKELVNLVKNIKKTVDSFPHLKDDDKHFDVDLEELYEIDESNVDIRNLKNILDCVKLNVSVNEFSGILNFAGHILNETDIKYSDFKTKDEGMLNVMLNYCNQHSLDKLEGNDFLMTLKLLNELHYVYMAAICEYISQMTDDFAMKEYRDLYFDH